MSFIVPKPIIIIWFCRKYKCRSFLLYTFFRLPQANHSVRIRIHDLCIARADARADLSTISWTLLVYLTLFGALSALGALVQAGQRGAKGSAGGETDLEAAGHSCCCGGPAATAAGDDDRASLLRPSAPPPDLARARGARAVDTEPRSTRSPRDPPIAYAVRVEDGS